ncbi:MAG: Cof-type HAD-IIB family hydrolase [Treponema sp.]|jgi:Cof subfamily protein (haloacid dehalogenase superfamily)|nr:Cof-type HAD-IIB family hydrolase [Treponema sp.]
MSYRGIIALDLDDTLLRSDLSISLRTKSTLKKAEAAGYLIVLASGRSVSAMDKYVRALNLHKKKGYVISSNGALIKESNTGNVMHQSAVSPEVGTMVYDLADAEGFSVQIYEDDTIYVSRRNEFTNADLKLTDLNLIVAEDFRNMAQSGPLKLLIPGDPMMLGPMEEILKNYLGDKAVIFTSKPYFLEILPENCHKGSALAKVAEMTNVPRESVIAIGDSMNDEAMIRWAGVGVCMQNGSDYIKDIADMVTRKTNNDDGVAGFIEEYVLPAEGILEQRKKGLTHE